MCNVAVSPKADRQRRSMIENKTVTTMEMCRCLGSEWIVWIITEGPEK